MVTILVLVHVLAAIVSVAARPGLRGGWRLAAAANAGVAGIAAIAGAVYVALSLRGAWAALVAATPEARVDAVLSVLAGRLGGILLLLGAGVLTAGGAVLLYARSRKSRPQGR